MEDIQTEEEPWAEAEIVDESRVYFRYVRV